MGPYLASGRKDRNVKWESTTELNTGNHPERQDETFFIDSTIHANITIRLLNITGGLF